MGVDLMGLAISEIIGFESFDSALDSSAREVALRTQKTVILGRLEYLVNIEIVSQSERLETAMSQGENHMSFSWLGHNFFDRRNITIFGIEFGSILYCKNGNFYHTEAFEGYFPTPDEVRGGVGGLVSSYDILPKMEKLIADGAVQLHFVHSHNIEISFDFGPAVQMSFLLTQADRDFADAISQKAKESVGFPPIGITSTDGVNHDTYIPE